jgi:hypothetical protein
LTVGATTLLAASLAVVGGGGASGTNGTVADLPVTPGTCNLDPANRHIKHVIVLGWDNFHFNQDNPNVPSDLEQVPALYKFIKDNGTLLTNFHTPLISHTATDFLTGYTGVYGDQHGIPIANSFGAYNPDGTAGNVSSFSYWTDPIALSSTTTVSATSNNVTLSNGNTTINVGNSAGLPSSGAITIDTSLGRQLVTVVGKATGTVTVSGGSGTLFTGAGVYKSNNLTPEMVNPSYTSQPAPWVPFTKAGCDVGNVATANMVLENNGLDIATVFGTNGPEIAESGPDKTDHYVGVAIHCAHDTPCSSAPNVKNDVLANEPGGYDGFDALYGHKYVAPFLGGTGTGSMTINDVYNGRAFKASDGKTYAPQTISKFPGFDGQSAAYSLGYVADMQEHGIPVTYAYLSDAHDCHTAITPTNSFCSSTVKAFGPGEDGYEAYLQSMEAAFEKFFQRLDADGINKSNTLFVFNSDEADRVSQFYGIPGALPSTAPTPANCDGVTQTCVYTHNATANPVTTAVPGQLGEVSINLGQVLTGSSLAQLKTAYTHRDSALALSLLNQPADSTAVVKQMAIDLVAAQIFNPYKTPGANPLQTNENVTNYLADQTEEQILHMVTADPLRTPSIADFAQPWEYIQEAGNCGGSTLDFTTGKRSCSDSGFAYVHGDYDPEPISGAKPDVNAMSANNTWVGFVGPGVASNGTDWKTLGDEVDIRPTLLYLAGLSDDYQHDGRVLTELLKQPSAALSGNKIDDLGLMLKRLDMASSPGLDRVLGDNQPEGFAGDTMLAVTQAAKAGDVSKYDTLLGILGPERDAVVADILELLDHAAFTGAVPASDQVALDLANGRCLLQAANKLAVSATTGRNLPPDWSGRPPCLSGV